MAHKNKVIRSINAEGENRCVDILHHPDGAFGYCEYRRDPEDARGWHPVGAPPRFDHPTAQAALDQALQDVVWLRLFV
ncbi:MAG: hypothetical protein AB8B51_02140 [Sedimentitalea sp.]